MKFNLILAGVGGQGILTIAQAISRAAFDRGWFVKQAEVHGMSQRGGAVYSHLRFADHQLFSDLIPLGEADLIIGVEPLEALRYVQYLGDRGAIAASSVPFKNIPDYPPVDSVLNRIRRYAHHVLLDTDRLARAAGSLRAANIALLGAASLWLPFDESELETSLTALFESKGKRIVDVNRLALRLGRSAARAYLDALDRGATPNEISAWLNKVAPEALMEFAGTGPDTRRFSHGPCQLTPPQISAVAQTLERVYQKGRRQLFEHEVYRLVELVGAISPPRHQFVPLGERVTPQTLDRFPGETVVLKLVSPQIIHKSESGAVRFVPRDADLINREIMRMIEDQTEREKTIEGVLVVEYVAQRKSGFGQELFVGIRSTREFGAIIAAGLGGVDTEYLAHKMKPGIAVAKALAVDTSPDEFLELFKRTAAYDVLSGRARGHERVVSDGELLRCFRAFIALARRFCVDRGEEGPDLYELEVNPFAFSQQRMIPLDGRGRLGASTKQPMARPMDKVEKLLEPQSIAVVGVSAKEQNFGRIILGNIKMSRFPVDRLYVIREDLDEIDGVRCVPTMADAPQHIDLLVIAMSAQHAPALIDEAIESGKVSSVILIPGGMGETAGTETLEEHIERAIRVSRVGTDGGPIVLGGNCLGVRSRPGRYDTFFIPEGKIDVRRDVPPRRCALISQSGAFIVSRMSNLELLDPAISISLGNQIDVTASDLLRAIGARDDIDAVGVYIEGFKDLDGLAFVRAVEEVNRAGKVVIFYKAGRTESGRDAAAGHTHSVAGDYDVCLSAVGNALGVVVDTFKEFEQLMELATMLHDKHVGGRRIGAITNAGYEAVGIADAILGARYELQLPRLSAPTVRRITEQLAQRRMDALVNVCNPLDLTAMADEEVYECCIRAMAADDQLDALIVGVIPLSPRLLGTEPEIQRPGSLAERLPELSRKLAKPIIAVIDAGAPYEAMIRTLRASGVPVFRSADQAVRSLGRYLCHRTECGHRDRPVGARHETPASNFATVSA